MLVYYVKKIAFIAMCCAFLSDSCTTMSLNDAMKKSKENRTMQNCEPLPSFVLTQIHGPAFDKRFMSIDKPSDNDEIISYSMDKVDLKRDAEDNSSIYISDDYTELLSETPAWNVDWTELRKGKIRTTRRKRSIQRQNNAKDRAPWQCEKRVKWIHLGPDFYPSHVRTVECTQSNCYYGMYDCVPRKFAIRILQRRRGACSKERDAAKLKSYGFNGKQAEVWEFVTHSLNFCCDCVKSDTHRYG